jgi:hypothetical protein
MGGKKIRKKTRFGQKKHKKNACVLLSGLRLRLRLMFILRQPIGSSEERRGRAHSDCKRGGPLVSAPGWNYYRFNCLSLSLKLACKGYAQIDSELSSIPLGLAPTARYDSPPPYPWGKSDWNWAVSATKS